MQGDLRRSRTGQGRRQLRLRVGLLSLGTPTETSASPFGPAYRLVSIGIVLQVTLVAFEALAVSTAMPVVAQELGGVREYGLAFSLFITANVFGVVAAGAWCDAHGPVGPLWAGFALFCGGLVVCGAAGTYPVLLLGRLVAGAGGGLLIVSLYVVIAQVYPQTLQPRVFGFVAAAWVVPAVVGPGIAGWTAEYLSWRLVFLVVPPLTLAAVLTLMPRARTLRASAEDPVPVSWLRIGRGFFAAVGVGLFQYGLIGPLWAVPLGVALLAVTVPFLLPVGTLWLRRGLPTVIALRGLLGGAFYAAEVFVPLMLVTERDVPVSLAGFALTGAAIGWMVGSVVQGRVRGVDRRHFVTLAGLLVGAAVAAMALTPHESVPVLLVVPLWFTAGIGMGLGMSTLSVLVLSHSDPGEEGRNSSSLHLGESLGNALAVGATGAVFAALHDPGGSDADVFSGMWLALGALGLFVALAGHRTTPRS